MANDFTKAMQALGGLAGPMGAGIGFLAGGPAGAAIGGAAGGILTGATGLLAKTPETVGVTGTQRSLMATQMGVIGDIQGQTGITAGQVGRMQQTAVEGQKQQLQQGNLAAQFAASPLEREMITTAIMNSMRSTNKDIKDRIAEFDATTEAQKQERLARATAIASQQANQIQAIEAQKRVQQMQLEQAKWNNFGTMLQSGVQGISGVMQYQDNKAAEETRAADMKKFREDYLATLRGEYKTPTSPNVIPASRFAGSPSPVTAQTVEPKMSVRDQIADETTTGLLELEQQNEQTANWYMGANERQMVRDTNARFEIGMGDIRNASLPTGERRANWWEILDQAGIPSQYWPK